MALPLSLLFLLPIGEMYLLIRLGGYLGAWPTIALVVVAGAAGVGVLRRLGPAALVRVFARMRAGAMADGQAAALELAEAALVAAAGLLLLLPGFMSDLAGLLLLVPGCRRWVAGRLLGRRSFTGSAGRGGPVVIEGEFERRAADPVERLRDGS